MTRYAFVIDQRKCIGCHACTVACKAEHDVPIGVYRTWVKYVEKGEFPNARRYFLVNRCNHCENAPCVSICPTKALFKRADGIVDFDSTRCIGCKSCMQACPYDALYIDPNTQTAAKCNYCAHRVEVGLEPACVVVCPERAIIAGDLHNPASEIARIVAREPVRTRKPEQGTGPNVYYLGAEEAAINPEIASEELPHMTMWSTLLKPGHEDERAIDRGRSLRDGQVDGRSDGRVGMQDDRAEYFKGDRKGRPYPTRSSSPQVVYDTPKNAAPWGWKVWAYLGTKSIGAGVMMVAALVLLIVNGLQGPQNGDANALLGIAAPVVGGFFIAFTLVLLIADLKRPDRALYIMLKSNPTSWLVWGAYTLGLLGLVQAGWFVAALFGAPGMIGGLLVPGMVFGAGGAGYTAFLFGQAEGRDFWQSPLLLPMLLIQALIGGSAALGLLSWALNGGGQVNTILSIVLLGALGLHVLFALVEVLGTHANRHVARAAHYLSRGALKEQFWGQFLVVGSIFPLAILIVALAVPAAQPALLAIAGVLAIVGLFVYEQCFVKAGQSVPLS